MFSELKDQKIYEQNMLCIPGRKVLKTNLIFVFGWKIARIVDIY